MNIAYCSGLLELNLRIQVSSHPMQHPPNEPEQARWYYPSDKMQDIVQEGGMNYRCRPPIVHSQSHTKVLPFDNLERHEHKSRHEESPHYRLGFHLTKVRFQASFEQSMGSDFPKYYLVPVVDLCGQVQVQLLGAEVSQSVVVVLKTSPYWY